MTRRNALLGVGSATAGAVAGSAVADAARAYADRQPLPFYAGYAAAVPAGGAVPGARGAGVHWSGDPASGAVALTFDDGPHPEWTPRLLDVLAAEDVPATFFVTGSAVRAHPRVHAGSAHHEIGNHTWSHPDLARLDHAACADELRRCTAEVEDALGRTPTLFRPPYGHLGGAALLAAGEAGLPVVLWSARMHEAALVDHPDAVVDDAAAQVVAGTVLLLHDNGADSRRVALDRLPRLVRALRDAGHTFATVSELVAPAG
jgi:peptidoglycan/xylan/chitin deacetylase (PgdA/CDA1 family)